MQALTDVKDILIGCLRRYADVLSIADGDAAAASASGCPGDVAAAIQSPRRDVVTVVPTVGQRYIYLSCSQGTDYHTQCVSLTDMSAVEHAGCSLAFPCWTRLPGRNTSRYSAVMHSQV